MPVIPPSAAEQGVRNAGKRPGVLADGLWSGRAIASFHATESDIDLWGTWGAGVGVRCDRSIVGVDIDTTTPRWSELIQQIAAETLGILPRRIGQAPKALLIARCDGADYRQIRFDDGSPPVTMHSGKIRPGVGLVELLAGPHRYFNVLAVHPKTGRDYALPDGIPHFDALPRVTLEHMDAFFLRLAAELPQVAGANSTSIDRASVDQSSLKGRDLDVLEEAIAWLPNDPSKTGYDEWTRMAAAFRGAFQDDYGRGLALFEEWSDKADIAEPTESAARVYGSINPPFAIGAGYIEAAAERCGWLGRAERWFDGPEQQPLFPLEGSAAAGDAPDRTRFRPVSFDEAAEHALTSGGRPLIKGLLDQGAMSVVYGESNSGKTFVALDIAYHVARGLNWAGMRTAQHSALYIAAEGGNGIRRRAGALKTRCGPAGDAFQLLPHTVDLLRPSADLGPLLAMIQQISPAPGLVVIDTLSRALAGGDENSPTDMGALVKHLDALRKASGAHILVVHHSGKDASKGARGHSLLRAATDTEIEIRDGQIAVTKQRDLDGSWSTPFSLEEVELGRDEDGDAITSCVIRLGAGAVDDGPVVSDEDMARIRQRVEAGTWRMTAKGRAKASWIGVAVGLALDIDISSNAGHGYVASIVEALIRSRQLIVTERHNAKTGRTEKIVGLPPAVSSWFDAAAAELALDAPAAALDGVFG